MIDLARLERLAAEATSGPWRWGTGAQDWPNTWLVSSGVVRHSVLGDLETVILNDDDPDETNAAFIAACDPATVAVLVQAVRAAQALTAYLAPPHREDWELGPLECALREALAVFSDTPEQT